MGFRYLGTDTGTQWLPGVPARDITNEEEQDYPEAEASPLYEVAGIPAHPDDPDDEPDEE